MGVRRKRSLCKTTLRPFRKQGKPCLWKVPYTRYGGEYHTGERDKLGRKENTRPASFSLLIDPAQGAQKLLFAGVLWNPTGFINEKEWLGKWFGWKTPTWQYDRCKYYGNQQTERHICKLTKDGSNQSHESHLVYKCIIYAKLLHVLISQSQTELLFKNFILKWRKYSTLQLRFLMR